MTPFSANPLVYIFPAIVIGLIAAYGIYAAVDRVGLDVSSGVATVTGKQFNPSGTTYRTTVVGGQTHIQSDKTPETYVLQLTVAGEPTVGLVSKSLFDSIQTDDRVQVKIRRTRISKRLEVVQVSR